MGIHIPFYIPLYSLLNGEQRSYLELPNQMIVIHVPWCLMLFVQVCLCFFAITEYPPNALSVSDFVLGGEGRERFGAVGVHIQHSMEYSQ